jgi:hypothetical protein
VSVNFSHALFYLAHFLIFEDGAKGLSQNASTELPLYAAEYPTRVQISRDDLAMQALVWVCMVRFGTHL